MMRRPSLDMGPPGRSLPRVEVSSVESLPRVEAATSKSGSTERARASRHARETAREQGRNRAGTGTRIKQLFVHVPRVGTHGTRRPAAGRAGRRSVSNTATWACYSGYSGWTSCLNSRAFEPVRQRAYSVGSACGRAGRGGCWQACRRGRDSTALPVVAPRAGA